MTMPTYGSSISFLQLQTEFGGAATDIALGNYYAGGSNIPTGTVAYPNGGGPTGAGSISVPSSGALRIIDFCAAAKLTVASFDLQFGSRNATTVTAGSWTVPRIIQGNITVTVIGGGTYGYGGPSAAKGGGGGGGAQRVISGTDLFRYVNPGDTIPYSAGVGQGNGTLSGSSFGTAGQEWYIFGGPASPGSSSPTGGSAGGGGTSSGTVPTYGTRSLGTGGNGGGTGAPGVTQGGGGGGQARSFAGGAGAGWGGAGGPGAPNGTGVIGSPVYMGFFPGGGGGGGDNTGNAQGAQGASGGVRIQYTGAV